MKAGSNTSPDFAARGGWWVVGQFALMLAVVGGGAWFPTATAALWHRPIAAVLLLAGACVGVAGAWKLGRNRTAYPAPVVQGHLVQDGIYGCMRHPLYSSLMFLSAGWSLWRWSWLAAAAAVGLTGLLAAKARVEERWLREHYAGYAQYARRVRRFIPGIW